MPPYEPPSSTSQSSRASSIQSERYFNQASRDSSHLRPEDAWSPPRKIPRQRSPLGRNDTITAGNTTSSNILPGESKRRRSRHRGRSGSRGRKATPWKKLLWVKQSYPDNYTDEETFLDHLQRNPRLRPYEFWPLVADSTIIVQHVCSVIIFVCCFTGIFQERISPTAVVGWATTGTVLGWVLRDYWVSQEEARQAAEVKPVEHVEEDDERGSNSSTSGSIEAGFPIKLPAADITSSILHGALLSGGPSRMHSRNPSMTSIHNNAVNPGATPSGEAPVSMPQWSSALPPYGARKSSFSPRTQERLATAKSAILIYCSLLGLSPILKSLTKSTSSDSIWALSSWLMGINVFTFDYGAGVEAKFPASLSTNAALMASTVLASRLPSTTHVFSLTLFSIEVFGLFPVFRRHLRHISWPGHLTLTVALVVTSSSGLSMIISGGGWGYAVFGVVLGGIITCLSMGVTSWWLIGLQRYKNEIHGPWDPARPVIRRHWD